MIEHNGKYYARVSDILKPFVDFSGISQEILNNKAALGTSVHDAINKEIEGHMVVLEGKAGRYFHSFEKWRAIINPVFVETEVRYYCDEKMVTGCIDALAHLEGEKKAVLIDFKTSAQESPTWIMQAHLYYYLLIAAGKDVSDRFLFIKLDRDGALPKVFQYKFDCSIAKKCMKAIDDFWEKRKELADKSG